MGCVGVNRHGRRHRNGNGHPKLSRSAPLYLTWRSMAMVFVVPALLIPIIIWRALVKLSARFLRPDLTHMLSSQGSLLLSDSVQKQPNLNLLAVMQVDVSDRGSVSDSDSLGRLPDVLRGEAKGGMERIVYAKAEAQDPRGHGSALAFPEMQQYCAKYGGYFFWKREPAFRIEDHVRVHKLGPAEDAKLFQANYVREPLPSCKSPWELLVLFVPMGEAYFLFKFHHSLGDGLSMMNAIAKSFDDDHDPAQFLEPSKYIKKVDGFIAKLALACRLVLELLYFLTARGQLLPWPRIPPEPFPSGQRNHLTSIAEHQLTSFEQLKGIAGRNSTSVTAVVYAGLAGALRAHLVSKYGAESIPRTVRFPQLVPSVFKHPGGLNNTLCSVTLELPVGEPDPASRLSHCHRVLEGRKQYAESLFTFILLQVLSVFPYTFPLRLRPADGAAAGIGHTNFPGPLNQVRVMGRKVRRINFQAAATPWPFYTGFLTYNGTIEWSVQGDARLLSQEELNQIADGIREEFNVLETMENETWQPELELELQEQV